MPPTCTDESLAASLADLRCVDQAIGVLIDHGMSPEAARQDLEDRAHAADTTVGVVGRAVLKGLSGAETSN